MKLLLILFHVPHDTSNVFNVTIATTECFILVSIGLVRGPEGIGKFIGQLLLQQ